MKKLMYRVFTSEGDVLFDDKAEAEKYVRFKESLGEHAILNKWTWWTAIEN